MLESAYKKIDTNSSLWVMNYFYLVTLCWAKFSNSFNNNIALLIISLFIVTKRQDVNTEECDDTESDYEDVIDDSHWHSDGERFRRDLFF